MEMIEDAVALVADFLRRHVIGLVTAVLASIGLALMVVPFSQAIEDPVNAELSPPIQNWIGQNSVNLPDQRAMAQYALALKKFALAAATHQDAMLATYAADLVRSRVCMARVEGLAAPATDDRLEQRLSDEGLEHALEEGRQRLPIAALAVGRQQSENPCDG
ncbi:MAG: hypothetical protein E6R08_10085 [Nevskiaceae bacterium]|nr:MAG: hypothetical protein E6R08_10085 [Nevskiaceae bacterium]